MAHGDFYRLFDNYWWLLFPLGWAIGQLIKLWLRHLRARQTFEVLKSYVDQGKEPPPEILKILQPESGPRRDFRGSYHFLWVPVFLFFAMALGFVYMAMSRAGDSDNRMGLVFTAILMAGLALGFLVSVLLQKKASDQDRLLPK